ncbi:FmdB family zinc ribbon protein [Candidatus Magnetominusculus xianensis]|uniref:Regulatory protein, FmdB family n=1 Tax=Candidatus Magnetominusculus xianensis TaxID=1748249 RepID=A0ABR5SMZ5_9BACT|nr:putative regulatory protein, FmdB family [Candidatus Magnetominusculus xianensis]MBF0403742.1 zinc ribbon domain-containing protein [Nitrospirota bacterium]
MPIYEYTCMDCKKQFTLLQKMGTSEAACPWCNSANTAKLLSKFSCTPAHDSSTAGSGHFGGT